MCSRAFCHLTQNILLSCQRQLFCASLKKQSTCFSSNSQETCKHVRTKNGAKCVVEENIHTHPKEGTLKMRCNRKPNVKSTKLVQNLQRSGRVKPKKTFCMRSMDIYWNINIIFLLKNFDLKTKFWAILDTLQSA